MYAGNRGDNCGGESVELLVQNVFNCVRSAAGLAIGGLLWEHPGWLERLRSGMADLIKDPHPVPRMAAATACVPVLRIDKDLAVSWFCAACQDDLRIAACEWAVEIFNSAIQSHDKQLSPIILAMCRSDRDDVAQEGAEEVTARWLFHGMFEKELAACRRGSAANRRGVAQVAAALLAKGYLHGKMQRDSVVALRRSRCSRCEPRPQDYSPERKSWDCLGWLNL